MDNQRILAWMNCYGAWAPELRSSVETKGYSEYLDGVIKYILPIKNQIRAFYISGGMIDQEGRTECQTVKPELGKRFAANDIDIKINADEESVTSSSIMKTFLLTWMDEYPKCKPLIFVDQVRFHTNSYAFEYYCQKFGIRDLKANEVIIPIDRSDTHPHSTIEYQNKKLETMKQVGVEEVERREIESRKNN